MCTFSRAVETKSCHLAVEGGQAGSYEYKTVLGVGVLIEWRVFHEGKDQPM